MVTGIGEIDTLLHILSHRYHGIYNVSLSSGKAHRILMPSYLSQFSESTDKFKDAFIYYVREMVHPDDRRAMMSFLNYEAIKRQVLDGKIPSISYKKVNGHKVVLSVYPLSGKESTVDETIWVFENQN